MSRKEVLRVSHFSNSSCESLLIFCTTGSKVPDPGSLGNVRTLGAKSLPIQEVFEAFFRSYITS